MILSLLVIKTGDTLLPDFVIHPQLRDYKQFPVSYFKLGLVAGGITP